METSSTGASGWSGEDMDRSYARTRPSSLSFVGKAPPGPRNVLPHEIGLGALGSASDAAAGTVERIDRARVSAVPDDDRQIAAEAGQARAQHRRSGDEPVELEVAQPPQRLRIRAVASRARPPGRVERGQRGETVRTHPPADVASENVPADCRTLPLRDLSLQLDRQVRDAPRRVELALVDESTGRARVDAERAGAALIRRRSVRRQLEAARHTREEDPRADVGVDDAGVLADPSQPRMPCIHALLHMVLVDEDRGVEWRVGYATHSPDERLQTLREHDVIVIAPGIARNRGWRRAAATTVCLRVATIARVIQRARDDDGTSRRQEAPDIRPRLGGLVQVDHLAGIPAVQPFAEVCELWQVRSRRDAGPIEAELLGARLDRVCGNHVRAAGAPNFELNFELRTELRTSN